MKNYHNPEVGLRCQFPADWQEVTYPNVIFLFMATNSNPDNSFRTNASLVMESAFGAPFLQILMKTRMGLRQQLEQFEELDAQPSNLSGAEGYRIHYRHLSNGIPLEVVYYLLLHEDAVYHLHFNTLQADSKQWLHIFETMAQSFEILPEEA
jgi:hypothetical protein